MRWFDTETRSAKILQMMERKLVFNAEQLSRKLNVSSKTIANEVTQLNKQLAGSALIDLSKGEYRLLLFDIPTFIKIRDEITKPIRDFDNPQIRISYIADLLMNTDDPCLIDDIAFDMDVSRSTLVGDLKRLKSIFGEYDIKIVGKPNTGLTLKGEEFEIRRFILENNYELIYSRDILDKDIWNLFEDLVDRYGLESSTADSLGRYLTVSLDRYLNGYPVHFPHPRYFDLKHNGLYRLADELADQISESLGTVLPPEERIFLTIPLSGMRTPVDWSGIENFIEIDEEIIELVQEIIDTIKDEMDLSFQFTELLDEFIYHLYFLRNRLQYGLHLENPVKEEMKDKFGLAWKMASRAAEIIKTRTGFTVSTDETGYLASYFEVFIQEQRRLHRKKFKVLVIHHSGGAAQRLIAYQLKKLFDEDTIVDIRPDRQDSLDDIENYDLLITTDHNCTESRIPMIELDEVFDEKLLRQRIERVRYVNQLDIPIRHGSHSVLLSLIDDSRVFVFDSKTPYQSILETMSRRLVDQGLVDKDFSQRLLEREASAPTRFSESVAFPHTWHLQGKSPCAAIGLLPEGCNDEGCRELRLVILSGLPREAEEDTTLVKLYDEIILIAENAEIIKRISKMDSYQDILHYFIAERPVFDQ
ncbi:MAG: BglG family transcription antiterminator [Eubacteriaceae bacterium]|jgi:lichenan operon transcriptional antiterminator